MTRAAGVVAIVLGVFAIALVLWFPSGALVVGALALAAGLFTRRHTVGTATGSAGAALGAFAIIATVVVIVTTTTP